MTNTIAKTVSGRVKIDKEVWELYFKQNIRDNSMFDGNIKTNRGGIIVNRRITWKISKYSKCTLTLLNEEITTATSAMAKSAAIVVTDRILELAEVNGHVIYNLFNKHWGLTNEVAADKTNKEVKETTTMTTIKLTPEAKEYMTAGKYTSGIIGMNEAVKELIAVKKQLAKAKAQLTLKDSEPIDIETVFNKLSKDDQEEFLYEHMPSEILESMGKDEEPEIITPDPEPEDKMPIPKSNDIDVEELKASLKAEILAELREELKASFVADKPKQETKKEEIKKEETKHRSSFAEKRAASTYEYESEDIQDDLGDDLTDELNDTTPNKPVTNNMDEVRAKAAKSRAEAKARRAAARG